jgi:hypothetical protein
VCVYYPALQVATATKELEIENSKKEHDKVIEKDAVVVLKEEPETPTCGDSYFLGSTDPRTITDSVKMAQLKREREESHQNKTSQCSFCSMCTCGDVEDPPRSERVIGLEVVYKSGNV